MVCIQLSFSETWWKLWSVLDWTCKFVATCQFGTFEDEMLRDHVITGLRDHEHRECLLRERLCLLFKKPLIFVVQMKWQQVNDSKWNKLTLFILSTGTKLAPAMRIHAKILARSKPANIAETPTQLETAQPLAKHALNVTKKSSCKSLSLHPQTQ